MQRFHPYQNPGGVRILRRSQSPLECQESRENDAYWLFTLGRGGGHLFISPCFMTVSEKNFSHRRGNSGSEQSPSHAWGLTINPAPPGLPSGPCSIGVHGLSTLPGCPWGCKGRPQHPVRACGVPLPLVSASVCSPISNVNFNHQCAVKLCYLTLILYFMAGDIWQTAYVQIHITLRGWDNPTGLRRLRGVSPPWWKSASCRFNCKCSSQDNSGPGFCLFTVLLLRARPRTRPTILDQGSTVAL